MTPFSSPSSPSSLLSPRPSFCPSTSSSRMWWTNSLCTSANEDLGTLAEYDPLTPRGNKANMWREMEKKRNFVPLRGRSGGGGVLRRGSCGGRCGGGRSCGRGSRHKTNDTHNTTHTSAQEVSTTKGQKLQVTRPHRNCRRPGEKNCTHNTLPGACHSTLSREHTHCAFRGSRKSCVRVIHSNPARAFSSCVFLMSLLNVPSVPFPSLRSSSSASLSQSSTTTTPITRMRSTIRSTSLKTTQFPGALTTSP